MRHGGARRASLPNPWAGLDTHVRYADLDGDHGAYDDTTGIIWLSPGMTQAERRSALAHERVHAERGDIPCATAALECRQETSVDREAARRLIPLAAFVDALLWCSDDRELAEELWVDEAMVRARREGLTPAEVRWVEEQIAVRERGA